MVRDYVMNETSKVQMNSVAPRIRPQSQNGGRHGKLLLTKCNEIGMLASISRIKWDVPQTTSNLSQNVMDIPGKLLRPDEIQIFHSLSRGLHEEFWVLAPDL